MGGFSTTQFGNNHTTATHKKSTIDNLQNMWFDSGIKQTEVIMKHTFAIGSDTLTTWLIQKNEVLICVMDSVIDDEDTLDRHLTMFAIHARMTLLEELTDLICAQGAGTLH